MLSGMACLPFIGAMATGGKLINKAEKLAKVSRVIDKTDDVSDIVTITRVSEAADDVAKITGTGGVKKAAHTMTDYDFLQRIATKAESTGVHLGKGASGTGPLQGTWKHNYAKRVLDRYQSMTGQKIHLLTEETYLNGAVEKYGKLGSSRPDVFDPLTGTIYDYKFVKNTGNGLSSAQMNKNLRNVPGLTSQFEINP
jgi:hypothetical protein